MKIGIMSQIKDVLKRVTKQFLALLVNVFYFLPLRKQILFDLSAAQQYTCNPKYITEYLLKNYPGKFKIVWALRDPKKFKYLEEKGIRVVKHRSFLHLLHMWMSKIVVANSGLCFFSLLRRGQFYIQTWHGTAYKKIGVDISNGQDIKKRTAVWRRANLFLSGNKRFTDIPRTAFRSDSEVLEVGTPRNDIFFTDYSDVVEHVRKYYGIPNDVNIVLYAPTFRADMKLSDYDFDYVALAKTLSSKFGEKWICMFRMHYFIASNYDGAERVIDASKYPDMQELLCAADVLITDYSSSMWDFSLTFKPCFVYATDIESYEQERGFYVPISEFPFPIATNNEELAQNILNFDERSHVEKIKKHHEYMGNCETGHAAQAVCERICEEYFK